MRLSKKLAAVAVAAGIVLTATTAYAFWTTTGEGPGSASTGTNVAVTVAQVGAVTGLVPGSAAQAVDFSITNPRSTPQYITSVVISKGAVNAPSSDLTHPCTADDFALVQPTASYGDLASGVHTYSPSGASLALTNSGSNQDGCKNASIALAFAAS